MDKHTCKYKFSIVPPGHTSGFWETSSSVLNDSTRSIAGFYTSRIEGPHVIKRTRAGDLVLIGTATTHLPRSGTESDSTFCSNDAVPARCLSRLCSVIRPKTETFTLTKYARAVRRVFKNHRAVRDRCV